MNWSRVRLWRERRNGMKEGREKEGIAISSTKAIHGWDQLQNLKPGASPRVIVAPHTPRRRKVDVILGRVPSRHRDHGEGRR
jgi:hypothetical protein